MKNETLIAVILALAVGFGAGWFAGREYQKSQDEINIRVGPFLDYKSK
jgi:hypothetical protein